VRSDFRRVAWLTKLLEDESRLSTKVSICTIRIRTKLVSDKRSAFTRTNDSTLATEVIALRNILEGEEIVISYLDASSEMTSRERRRKISSEWNFKCGCSICHGDDVTESDRRRRQITKVQEKLSASFGDAPKMLEYLKQLLELFEREDMIMPKAEHYEVAAYAANHLGKEEEAMEFAKSAKMYWRILAGRHSPKVKEMEEFERDPRNHPSRGGS
jgi:hypothetical protein